MGITPYFSRSRPRSPPPAGAAERAGSPERPPKSSATRTLRWLMFSESSAPNWNFCAYLRTRGAHLASLPSLAGRTSTASLRRLAMHAPGARTYAHKLQLGALLKRRGDLVQARPVGRLDEHRVTRAHLVTQPRDRRRVVVDEHARAARVERRGVDAVGLATHDEELVDPSAGVRADLAVARL